MKKEKIIHMTYCGELMYKTDRFAEADLILNEAAAEASQARAQVEGAKQLLGPERYVQLHDQATALQADILQLLILNMTSETCSTFNSWFAAFQNHSISSVECLTRSL